jgi:Trypsin-co-occurring domain 1
MNTSLDATTVPVVLSGGRTIKVEATVIGGPQKVGILESQPFQDLLGAVEDLGITFSESLRKAKPTKGSIEFGVEVGLEAGKLVALLCQGTGKANLKITLEWGA